MTTPTATMTRERDWTGTATVRNRAVVVRGPGAEINGRDRSLFAIATVTTPPSSYRNTIRTLVEEFDAPYNLAGIPYADGSYTPWQPTSVSKGEWGSYDIIIGGVNVTTFRTDRDGNPIPTRVLRMTDKVPGGDDLLDLMFPSISALDHIGSGDLAWCRADEPVLVRQLDPDGHVVKTCYEGTVSPIEDNVDDATWQFTLHCIGIWDDLDRFITLPRPSIDQWIRPIPNGHLTPVDTAQFIYAHAYRAQIYGWPASWLRRPADSGIPYGEQGSYGEPLAARTFQDALSYMQSADSFTTVVNVRPRHLDFADIDFDSLAPAFSLRCMQRGVTHNLTLDPTVASSVIYGHGQAPWGPVDDTIGRPDALADWMNWQYPAGNFDPPNYPLGDGDYFDPGDGETGFQPFSDELRRNGYRLSSQDTYLSSDEGTIRRFQNDTGIQVDGVVGAQTWLQAFQVGVDVTVLAQSYVKEIASTTFEQPFRTNARGGVTEPNPYFDPRGHPRREVLEQFGPISKDQAVQSAAEERGRIHLPIYRGTITAKNIDPPQMCALDTRSGMAMLFQNHAGVDRKFFVTQVERVPGTEAGTDRTVTWTVSEQPEGLMTMAARLARDQGIRDLTARNRPPRHHAKQIESFPVFDAESGAGVLPPGQGQTGGLWQKFLIPMGGQVDANAVKLVANHPVRIAAAMFANPYLTVSQLIALPGLRNPSVGDDDPWAKNEQKLLDLGICWSMGNPQGMGGYWPNDPADDSTGLTGVLADLSSWPFRTNSTYGCLMVWTNEDCKISGDPAANYRVIFPEPVSA